jgi:hypothetical protein
MSEKDEKLKASPPSKYDPSSAASATPSSANAPRARKTPQGRSSLSSATGGNLSSILLVLAFAACFLQLFLSQPDYLLQKERQNHWFDPSLWTLDNATLNQNIMGVDLAVSGNARRKGVDQSTSRAADGPKNEVEEQIKEELKEMHLNADAFPKADIANDEHPIIQLLRNAGIDDLTEEDKKHLPDWKALQRLYGDLEEPIIIGLETCAMYRNTVPPPKRYAAVAGLFNTGTNAMEHHLRKNINLESAWQGQ